MSDPAEQWLSQMMTGTVVEADLSKLEREREAARKEHAAKVATFTFAGTGWLWFAGLALDIVLYFIVGTTSGYIVATFLLIAILIPWAIAWLAALAMWTDL